MATDKPKKAFDCVEMKRRIQEKIYEDTHGMGPEELAAYLRRRVREGPFADLWHPGTRRAVEERTMKIRPNASHRPAGIKEKKEKVKT